MHGKEQLYIYDEYLINKSASACDIYQYITILSLRYKVNWNKILLLPCNFEENVNAFEVTMEGTAILMINIHLTRIICKIIQVRKEELTKLYSSNIFSYFRLRLRWKGLIWSGAQTSNTQISEKQSANLSSIWDQNINYSENKKIIEKHKSYNKRFTVWRVWTDLWASLDFELIQVLVSLD